MSSSTRNPYRIGDVVLVMVSRAKMRGEVLRIGEAPDRKAPRPWIEVRIENREDPVRRFLDSSQIELVARPRGRGVARPGARTPDDVVAERLAETFAGQSPSPAVKERIGGWVHALSGVALSVDHGAQPAFSGVVTFRNGVVVNVSTIEAAPEPFAVDADLGDPVVVLDGDMPD